ncbi:unnamed protein product [Alopecurus aequalis]
MGATFVVIFVHFAARRLLLSVAVVAVALLAPRRAVGYPWTSCGDEVGFPTDSDYKASLSLLAATMPKNASMSPGLFATAQAGVAPEQVWALALCRGDSTASFCSSCLDQAFQDLTTCGYKEATIYYDSCLVTYSNIDFRASDDNKWSQGARYASSAPTEAGSSSRRSSRTGALITASRGTTLLLTTTLASTEKSPQFYATEGNSADSSIGIGKQVKFATPPSAPNPEHFDIGVDPEMPHRYRRVLDLVEPDAPVHEQADRLLLTPSGEPSTYAEAEQDEHWQKKKTSAPGISVGIACSLILILIISVFMFIRFNRRITATTEHDNPLSKISRAQCVIFDLPTLEEATENFSQRNKLGEGSFGVVYKGILVGGQEIAVKKLIGRAGHGLHQLHNEVLLLAELQHKNLVRLQAFYSHRDDTLLVYEYIKNGNLDNFLSDTKEGHTLTWEQWYNIILGIAKGILYLHEDSNLRIIHRDLKPNNILLDEDMEPKIADFGLARLLGEGHTHTKTARVAGTPGPEYVSHRRVSPKIDIFSYGVLILQIVTRRRECWSDEHVNLLTEVWNHWKKETISQMMEQTLEEHTRNQQLRCIHVGLLCVQEDPVYRPEMSTIISMLTRDNTELQPPEVPAFFFGGFSRRASTVNGVTITEPYPR